MTAEWKKRFDLVVIGCGPGGYAGAMRAFDLGKDVCVVEKGAIGGTGVLWGALASKTLWEISKDYRVAIQTNRGYRIHGMTVDFSGVRKSAFQAVKEKQSQMSEQFLAFSPRRWQGPGSITFKKGKASFISETEIQIVHSDGREEVISGDFFLIATGSTPRALPHAPFDHTHILSSDDILRLRAFPKRLMVIGAGIVGCEYATIFSNFNQTKVFLVDHAERIIPYEDEDVSDFVGRSLQRNGVTIFHSAKLDSVDCQSDDSVSVTLGFSSGKFQQICVDAVLVAIGREPSLKRLGLEKAGISPNEKGFLDVDADCRVKERIYAAGDVTTHPALVNLAEMEARHAVEHMFGEHPEALSYRNMSTVMFFNPAVAAVGLNERNCREKNIPYKVGFYANSLLSRAIAMRSLAGFVKIIVRDDPEEKIIGMRAAGPEVSNTIMSIAMPMDQGKGLRDVLKSVYPHPTMCEGIEECLRLLQGDSIYKPGPFPDLIKIRRWRPEGL